MGMFDYIRCKMPLPADPAPPKVDLFQTKDTPTFQLWLDIWEIRGDGSLVKLGYRIEDRSDKTAPAGSWESLSGCMTKVYDPAMDETVPFHGDIHFYGFIDGEWWEYRARFTDGICGRIDLIEYTPAKTGDDAHA